MHTVKFSLCLLWLTRKGASTSKELMGSLVVSGPFLSASYCPNAALTCCSLVLTLALLWYVSYKALLCDISCIGYTF